MPNEEIPKSFLDAFTSIDERLDRNHQTLKRIADALTGVPITIEPTTTTDQILNELLQLEKDRRLEETDIIEFIYPSGGGTATLPIGKTIVNLLTGKVSLPDGTEALLTDSLESHDRKHAKSVYIENDKDIVISFDNKGSRTIDADDSYLGQWMSFSTIYITTTESTNISLRASTNPIGDLGGRKKLNRIRDMGPQSVRYGVDFSNKHWTGGAMLPANTYTEFAYDIPPEGEQWYISSISQSATEATDEHRVGLSFKDVWTWFDSYYFRQAQWLFPDKFVISAGSEIIVTITNRSDNPGYFLTHIGAMVVKV